MFVSGWPTLEEVRNATPFIGLQGRIAEKIAYTGGLQWATCGRTCLVKRAPTGGYDESAFKATFLETAKVGNKKVIRPNSELEQWRELLLSELESIKPTTVIACGDQALEALTGQRGVYKLRGSVLAGIANSRVVPIINPLDIQQHAAWQELYISGEIIKRKVVANNSVAIAPIPWESITSPTLQDWRDFSVRIGSHFTLDIETRGGSIACVGLAYRDTCDRAICVPIQTTRGPYWADEADEHEFWRILQQVCERSTLVAHNIFYDCDWLRDYGILPHNIEDTMLLFHRFYPELPKTLAFVAMWLTDIPYYKDDGKTWGYAKPDEQLWTYNIQDCIATLRAWEALDAISQTKFNAQRRLYDEFTKRLLPVAFEMQTLGMAADVVGVDYARQVLTHELEAIRSTLARLSNDRLVTRKGNKKITDKQVAEYLYNELGLAPKYNRKTKALTADEDALIEILIQHPHLEVLKALNAERKFNKALNSYIDISWQH